MLVYQRVEKTPQETTYSPEIKHGNEKSIFILMSFLSKLHL